VLFQDKLAPHQIVHAQLDRLPLMVYVQLVAINAPLVKIKSITVLLVFLNHSESKLTKTILLVTVKLVTMMMVSVLIVKFV